MCSARQTVERQRENTSAVQRPEESPTEAVAAAAAGAARKTAAFVEQTPGTIAELFINNLVLALRVPFSRV